VPILVEYLALSALLPLVLVVRRRLGDAWPLGPRFDLIPQLVVVSFGLFWLAHLVLFRLHLPSRYVKFSLPIVLAVLAGIALGLLAEAACRRLGGRHRLLPLAASLALVAGLALYPADYGGGFKRDRHPELTRFLQNQPRDSLIAGVPIDTDSLPAFARRSVLTSREFSVPLHLGYYRELRQRTFDLIEAYYAATPAGITPFVDRYGVDLLLVNRLAYNPSTARHVWTGSYGQWPPYVAQVTRRLQRGSTFALLELATTCAAFDDRETAVVPAACLRA
jgi:hypothetical protein